MEIVNGNCPNGCGDTLFRGDGGYITCSFVSCSAPDAASNLLENGLNAYSAQSHEDNRKWWIDLNTGEPLQRNKGELMMLMVSEIAEAMEGARKNLMDDKLPHRKMEEVELADCLIRIFDYAGAHALDLEGAYQEKREYNAQREDHKHEARLQDGGKKW